MAAWRFWLLFGAEFLVVGGAARFVGASCWGASAAALAWLIGLRAVGLGFFFVLSRWRRAPGPPDARLGPAASLRWMLNETWATLAAFFYLHPVAEWFNRDPPPGAPGTPVLFIHGFLSNAGFWHPLKKWLAQAGQRNSYAVTLGPPFAPLDDLAAELAQQVERIYARADAPLVLVAHSMGGLIARACLERGRAPGRVKKLITLGSPHHGTGAAFFLFGANTRQMRPGSAWLRQYDERLAAGHPVPVLSVYSRHDNIVFPQDSSVLPHARNLALTGLGHMAMAFAPEIRKMLLTEIAHSEAGAAGGIGL